MIQPGQPIEARKEVIHALTSSSIFRRGAQEQRVGIYLTTKPNDFSNFVGRFTIYNARIEMWQSPVVRRRQATGFEIMVAFQRLARGWLARD